MESKHEYKNESEAGPSVDHLNDVHAGSSGVQTNDDVANISSSNDSNDDDSDVDDDDDDNEIDFVALMERRVESYNFQDDELTQSTIFCPSPVKDITDNFDSTTVYESYLKTLEPLIDDYLEEVKTDPTDDMVRYANFNWMYSGLTEMQRSRLNHLRIIVGMYTKELKDYHKNVFYNRADQLEKKCVNKKPVCAYCLYDLRNDFFLLRRLYMLMCGHVFHRHCVKKHMLKYKNSKCGICNCESDYTDGQRIYLSYR